MQATSSIPSPSDNLFPLHPFRNFPSSPRSAYKLARNSKFFSIKNSRSEYFLLIKDIINTISLEFEDLEINQYDQQIIENDRRSESEKRKERRILSCETQFEEENIGENGNLSCEILLTKNPDNEDYTIPIGFFIIRKNDQYENYLRVTHLRYIPNDYSSIYDVTQILFSKVMGIAIKERERCEDDVIPRGIHVDVVAKDLTLSQFLTNKYLLALVDITSNVNRTTFDYFHRYIFCDYINDFSAQVKTINDILNGSRSIKRSAAEENLFDESNESAESSPKREAKETKEEK